LALPIREPYLSVSLCKYNENNLIIIMNVPLSNYPTGVEKTNSEHNMQNIN